MTEERPPRNITDRHVFFACDLDCDPMNFVGQGFQSRSITDRDGETDRQTDKQM